MQFFDELPAGRATDRVQTDWAQAKADLIENEGQWGLMAENVSDSTRDQLRAGKYRAFRGEELEHFEFVARKPENPEVPYAPRRADIYGRYTAKVS